VSHKEVYVLSNRLRSVLKKMAWKISSPAVHHLDMRMDELADEERDIHAALARQDEQLEAISHRLAAIDDLGQTMALVRELHARVGVLDAVAARITVLDELGRVLGGSNLPEQVAMLEEKVNGISETLDTLVAQADLDSILGMASALQRFVETLSDRMALTLAQLESLAASVNGSPRHEP
jgi:archaellum component FlaC